MPLPYVPFYFRGAPRSREQAELLESVLVSAHLDISTTMALPGTVQTKRYQPSLQDSEVIKLYPPHLLKRISTMFVRLLLIIPWSLQLNGGLGRSVQIIKQSFPNVEDDTRTAKYIIFLEQEEQILALNAVYSASSSRDWLRRTEAGLIFIVPLYDERRVRSLSGSMKEFIELPNEKLASVYSSISAPSRPPDSSPTSSRRRV